MPNFPKKKKKLSPLSQVTFTPSQLKGSIIIFTKDFSFFCKKDVFSLSQLFSHIWEIQTFKNSDLIVMFILLFLILSL